jgi:flagellar biosynthesis/type III secretory pathway protein FliH
MRTNCERHEPRHSVCVEQSETEIEKALREAYERGYDDGFEEARESFIQTQMLLSHTGGSA